MPVIKRQLTVTKIPRPYTSVEVFYIVWNRDEIQYFLQESSLDGSHLMWTTNKEQAVGFIDGNEAMVYIKEIHKTRKGPGIIELKIVTEKKHDPDSDQWMI